MRADIPLNETLRIKALHDLAILDTPREQNFDDLAQVALQLCGVPIAVISLIDTDRQWFKSCLGMEGEQTPRDIAFCAHAILSPEDVTLVEDALQDPRFADNELVTGEPHIRFYAGAPLITEDGYALGTLCVVDYKPRSLSADQLSGLKALARQVMQLVRLKDARDALQSYNQAIAREQARLAAIIEGTNVGTWEWDLPTGNQLINDRWASMLGYSREDLGALSVETWRRLLHPDDARFASELLERHLSGETDFFDCELRMLCKDGGWRWVRTHGKVTARDAAGNALVMSGMHTDINDIKLTYNRLKEREDLLRSMLSNFPGAAYRCENNANWTMRYLSEAVEQLTGYPARDFIGDVHITFAAITHPEDIEEVNYQVQQALAERKTFDIEYRIKRADGQWRHMQEIGRGVYDQAGNLQYIDGFIWDVQARHDSDYERRLMANKMSQLFEMAPIGILQVNDNGHLLEANPEFCKLLGYTQEELRTMTFLDLTPRDDWEKSLAATGQIKTRGRFGPLEKSYLSKEGELVPVEISGALISTPEGDSQCWWTLVKDIREQKRIERMKNEFISTVSHELRTPLTSISGALGLISSSALGALPEKAAGMLDIAYKNSRRLTVLINDLLDMEKLLAGKMYFDLKVQPLAPLIEQAMLENQSYADKFQVGYRLRDEAPDAVIKVDALRLQQVLSNLFSNAAKYSHAGEVVDIQLVENKGWVRISVRDYGTGIPIEFRDRIFQKFSQADATDSRQKGGTGLGLAISKELVERMGGRIGFDSELGEGSHFFAEFKNEAPGR